jgi:hypothetical protein
VASSVLKKNQKTKLYLFLEVSEVLAKLLEYTGFGWLVGWFRYWGLNSGLSP